MQGLIDLAFLRLSDVQFIAFMRKVIAALGLNPLFAGPWPGVYPSLDVLRHDTDAFEELCNAAANKDVVKGQLKDRARKELETKAFRTSQYVDLIADGDPFKLIDTGFAARSHAAKNMHKFIEITMVEKFVLNNGPLPGSCFARCARTPNAASWEIQWNSGDVNREEDWKPGGFFTHCSKMEMYNLDSIKKINFRIRALGHNTFGPWTPPTPFIVH